MEITSAFVSPFSAKPNSPEATIAQIRSELVADYEGGPAPRDGDLDRAADTAVRALWGARVTAFVPLLALRYAREALRALGPVGVMAQRGAPRLGRS